jgi:hypothetical protein
VLFTWQQRFESLALGFESSRNPAKFAKRFESSNPDSRTRLTTKLLTQNIGYLNFQSIRHSQLLLTKNVHSIIGVKIKRCNDLCLPVLCCGSSRATTSFSFSLKHPSEVIPLSTSSSMRSLGRDSPMLNNYS